MISLLLKVYNNYKYKKKKNYFYKIAEIGDMFDIEPEADIRNESGEKERIKIGHHVRINGNLVCKSTGKIQIGNFTSLQDGVVIGALESIIIGNYVGIAANTSVVDNNNHPIDPKKRIEHRIRVSPGGEGYPGLTNGWELSESKPIIIEDNVWIGMNCVILKGLVIGEGSIVARNSVVTKSVPPYSIVAGNPAKIVKKIPHDNVI